MSHPDQRDFFYDTPGEVYRCGQKREEKKDQQAQSALNKLVIENSDPEMEQVIAALERGWLEETDRS